MELIQYVETESYWAQENCIKSGTISEYFKTFENIPEGI